MEGGRRSGGREAGGQTHAVQPQSKKKTVHCFLFYLPIFVFLMCSISGAVVSAVERGRCADGQMTKVLIGQSGDGGTKVVNVQLDAANFCVRGLA